MQPADSAPAATEPPTAGGHGEPAVARDAARVVPQPRTSPAAGAPAVPQPRPAADPDAASAPPSPAPAPARDAAVAAAHVTAPTGDVEAGVLPGGVEAGAVSGDVGVQPADARTGGGLAERERGILAFEQQWWRHAGAKEQAIRDTFGVSATRYYQLLNALLDNPAALAAEPVLIGRLRRLRSSRARNRRR
ncbi:DUF3263 domain-containing protein [Micromonospora sp. KLBMP9576]|uniref:DUF3263 domain-containing protein n=1 Tax=Micromonospora sp. KLBMP9576 TaxID=3424769 RepID=UPI003D8B2FD1